MSFGNDDLNRLMRHDFATALRNLEVFSEEMKRQVESAQRLIPSLMEQMQRDWDLAVRGSLFATSDELVSSFDRGFLEALQNRQWYLQQQALIDARVRSIFPREIDALCEEYGRLGRHLAGAALLPSVVTEFPPFEVFTAVDVLGELSCRRSGGAREPDTEHLELRVKLQARVDADLCPALEEVEPALVNLWQGAREARHSKNPDRVRHLIVSQRELVTRIIHTLAPDDAIRAWTKDPALYDEKRRPTRKARLRYIYRRIDSDPFGAFVEKDVEAALATIKLFHRGTHRIESDFTDQQCDALLQRVELLALFLLTIGTET